VKIIRDSYKVYVLFDMDGEKIVGGSVFGSVLESNKDGDRRFVWVCD
jgi:hypothetical protein